MTNTTDEKTGLLPDDPRHGTAGGYTNHGCRCEACKAAFAQAIFVSQQRRLKRGLPDGDKRHGTPNGYSNYGCRCDACKQARKDERNRGKAGHAAA